MQVGVFCPIGNNGWLISKNSPQYKPTFELNKEIVLSAEKYGFDFALSMIKLRGFGGETEFWDYNLESFTLMSGLAAVTSKIKIFATSATLVMPPAIVARMATTLDSISNGRFGLNVVTGWQRPEYSQMGMWPGDEFFGKRYQYLSEYVQVLKDLWGTGSSDFKGEFFKMDDCQVKPTPSKELSIICAGQSDAGLEFSAKYATYNFVFGKGFNTPTAFAPINDRLKVYTDQTGRNVATLALFMVITAETDEEAMEKWTSYNEGADLDAIAWLQDQGAKDKTSGADTNVRSMTSSVSPVNINMGTLVGSFEKVAGMLDEISEVKGTEGILLTFDDFVQGVNDFGEKIQPLMKSRIDVDSPVPSQVKNIKEDVTA
ncbi:pyrimidine utilization protein A [Acinetobacter rathckeae]|uniref:pyrimidine utilization protein A n=1 Tax=Acinetobacter rathckeae TaxID=2605272 RepID=UPI0018A3234A|nr:pyrimidine utilization protein A [Acinetobacter rathckeae]MBF7688129.1 pyrimidine utilization protein A [Acinetobacter rathckeae]